MAKLPDKDRGGRSTKPTDPRDNKPSEDKKGK